MAAFLEPVEKLDTVASVVAIDKSPLENSVVRKCVVATRRMLGSTLPGLRSLLFGERTIPQLTEVTGLR
jgi:hypothetical protein